MEPEWSFQPRQKVRIRRGSASYCAELDGIVYEVVGVRLNRLGREEVHVSENWPRDGGMDEVDPMDLELA